MTRKIRSLILGITLSLALFGLSSYTSPVANAAITITPPRFELFGNPGDILSEKIRVRNDEETAINYTTTVEDFKAEGDEGEVNLIEKESDVENASFSMQRWITVEPRSASINPGEEKVFEVTIRIPRDAEPGGHFASVLVERSGSAASGGSGASVSSRLGSLLLMRVSGNVTEQAKIDAFKAQNNYYQNGPVTLELRTKNEGNTHIKPKGRIVISNIFGKKVAEIPLTSANVLPGAARVVRSTWDQKNLIGRYTATLFAEYGTTGSGTQVKQLSATTTFIVFPMWLIWTILGLIVVIFLLITQRKAVKKFINRLTAD